MLFSASLQLRRNLESLPVRDDIRSKIVELIRDSRWAKDDMLGGLEATARNLGVLPQLLIEARIEKRLGRKVDRKTDMSLHVSPNAYKLLREAAEKEHATAKGLGRSLIHIYLSQSEWDPKFHENWSDLGTGVDGRKNVYHFAVLPSALEAFNKRAEWWGESRPKLFRSLLIDYLLGRFPYKVRLVGVKQMFARADDYCLEGPPRNQ